MAEEGLQALLESGDIDDHQKAKFISAVKSFWTTVHQYATTKLPHNDEVLQNCQWIDFFQRNEAKYSQVKIFLSCFPAISLTPGEVDLLREEFDDYKTVTDDEVDTESCSMEIEYKDMYGNMVKKKDYKLDKVWGNIGKL